MFNGFLSLSAAVVVDSSRTVALTAVEVVVVSGTGDDDADQEQQVRRCWSIDNGHRLASTLTQLFGSHVGCLALKSGRRMSSTKNLDVV